VWLQAVIVGNVKFLRQSISHLFLSLVVIAAFVSASAIAQEPSTLTGDIRLHKIFHSVILNNDRVLIVFLPPGYEANNRSRYPVFYLNDGQNLFDGATSFIRGQEWRVDETAQFLINARRIEPLIIVGIYHTGDDRINEFGPVADKNLKIGGKADLYGRMLVEELKPFIDHTYRTRNGSRHTGLGGSSMGGIVSLYLGLKYPNVFGRVAVISPSVWFADKQIVRYVDTLPKKSDVRIWLDMGTKEGRNPEEAARGVDDARLLRDTLLRKGWKVGRDFKYVEAENAEHNERAWAARVEPILTFLFPQKM
jgi:predicted alpha/beta superfamily hydrolase